jgi:cyclin-dependent kinase-like
MFAEISNGLPLFPGESDIDQLCHIIKCFGPLTARHMEVFSKNPLYVGVKLPTVKTHEPLEKRFPNMEKTQLSILKVSHPYPQECSYHILIMCWGHRNVCGMILRND